VAYVVDAPGKRVNVEEIIKGGVDPAVVEEAIAVELKVKRAVELPGREPGKEE